KNKMATQSISLKFKPFPYFYPIIQQKSIMDIRKHLIEIIPALAITLLCLSPVFSFSQGKQANIWYFGAKAGVDFNQGSPPIALLNSQMHNNAFAGCASISDSSGNLLFYSDGRTIWNKNHIFMQNGQVVGVPSTQGAMIVPFPDNNHLYYFFNFTWDNPAFQYHFQYSIIDMDLDNGNGGVVADKKEIRLLNNSSWHLSAVHHVNGKDIWVLAHGYQNDGYYAYLATVDSLHHTPIISQVGSVFDGSTGYMKISPNGKKVAAAVNSSLSGEFFDLVDFNNETGMVSDINLVHKLGGYYGVEFSPDNTKLYTNGIINLYQYDLTAGSPQDILESEVILTDNTSRGALQLGPDGKIYCSFGGNGSEFYLSVIHSPNEAGLACNLERDAVYLEGKITNEGLPSFIQSYLNDPTFTAQHFCLGDATTFEIDDTNGIDSVYWKFNDLPNMPNDTSTRFSPEYVFSHAGTYHVDLTVYSGLLEKTVTQDITIHPIPEPNLGSDTMFCNTGFVITLKPNCDGTYRWNDFSTGPELVVSDTGIYWVRATLNGC
ncbi:MAG: hypothetical protein COW63_03080, partial [Bacteroidetes bacterium CG18_big_fil_WC_8_21_14_2_50_41_14]